MFIKRKLEFYHVIWFSIYFTATRSDDMKNMRVIKLYFNFFYLGVYSGGDLLIPWLANVYWFQLWRKIFELKEIFIKHGSMLWSNINKNVDLPVGFCIIFVQLQRKFFILKSAIIFFMILRPYITTFFEFNTLTLCINIFGVYNERLHCCL